MKVLSLINAIVCCGAGRNSLRFRMHIRHELERHGMSHILRQLKTYDHPALQKHIEIYESVALDDAEDLAEDYAECGHTAVDLRDNMALIAALNDRFKRTKAAEPFNGLLAHLALLAQGGPEAVPKAAQQLRFLLAVAEQLGMRELGEDLDQAVLDFKTEDIVAHYCNVDDVEAANNTRDKATKLKEEYLMRCTKAEERARDVEDDATVGLSRAASRGKTEGVGGASSDLRGALACGFRP
jgi:dishevelled associated activator of morphogenesis